MQGITAVMAHITTTVAMVNTTRGIMNGENMVNIIEENNITDERNPELCQTKINLKVASPSSERVAPWIGITGHIGSGYASLKFRRPIGRILFTIELTLSSLSSLQFQSNSFLHAPYH